MTPVGVRRRGMMVMERMEERRHEEDLDDGNDDDDQSRQREIEPIPDPKGCGKLFSLMTESLFRSAEGSNAQMFSPLLSNSGRIEDQ